MAEFGLGAENLRGVIEPRLNFFVGLRLGGCGGAGLLGYGDVLRKSANAKVEARAILISFLLVEISPVKNLVGGKILVGKSAKGCAGKIERKVSIKDAQNCGGFGGFNSLVAFVDNEQIPGFLDVENPLIFRFKIGGTQVLAFDVLERDEINERAGKKVGIFDELGAGINMRGRLRVGFWRAGERSEGWRGGF